MKQKYAISLLLISIIIMNCDQNNREVTSIIKKIELNGKVIQLAESGGELCLPADFVLSDNYIIIRNRSKCNFIFTLVDLKTQSIIKNFGKRGRGPEEFNNVKLMKSRNNGSFEFFESNKNKYFRVEIKNIIEMEKPVFKLIAEFKKTGKWDDLDNFSNPSKAYCINDSTFITRDYYKDGMFGLCNNYGELLGVYFEYPDANNNVNPQLKKKVFQARFRAHPDQDKFVSMFFFSDWIKIYEYENTQLIEIIDNYTRFPKYRNIGGSLINSTDEKLGNITLDVNSENIYVLYSDKYERDAFNNGYLDQSTNKILVYDWDGKIVAKYKLNHNAFNVAVDTNNKYIYTLSNDPFPVLIRYDLK